MNFSNLCFLSLLGTKDGLSTIRTVLRLCQTGQLASGFKKRTRLCQLNRFKSICRSKEQRHHEKEDNKQPNTRGNAIVKRMQMVVAMNRSEGVTIVRTKKTKPPRGVATV